MKILLMLAIFAVMITAPVIGTPILLSGIDPQDVQYNGKLSIDVMGVGATPTQLSFLSAGQYAPSIIKIGGQKIAPPTRIKLGLMNYDHTKKPGTARVLPMRVQYENYINGLITQGLWPRV
jgi:hypothetical protein